ncbi:MAG: hypothetical protein AAF533_28440 [Acidobacteriota bacterium]
MIIGFNTDIKFRGKVFHAQTEDHGTENPMIETLVYIGGHIHDAFQTHYADMMTDGLDEAKIVQLMENQHRRIIGLIRSGHFLSDEEKAEMEREMEEKLHVIGGASGDERSFDELVSNWIDNEMEEEEVELIMSTDGELVAGSTCELRLKASKSLSRGAVANASLTINFISTVSEPTVVFEGQTDRMGECVAAFTLPSLNDGNAAIIVKCESELGTSELRQLVQRAA